MTGAPGAPLLSAALIVRDEEAHLGACLRSLDGVVDEIVVVDTGSVDGTRDVARRHGARLIERAWSHDFAAARNHALDHARGAWILYIDADERVSHAGDVRRTLEDPGAVAGLVRFRVQTGFTAFWEYRLFRNRPDIRFRGAIHETMVPDILARVAAGDGRVVETGLALDHLGYDGDRTRKHRRDLPLLQRAVVTDPGRLYLWHASGAAHLGLGDREAALDAWERGVAVLRAHTGPPQAAGLLLSADLAAERLRAGAPAPDLVAEAQARHPEHPLTWWLAARYAAAARRAREAIAYLHRLVAIDPERYVDRSIAMDRRIFGESAYELLGSCWLQLGRAARADKWLARAEAARAAAGDAPSVQLAVKRQLAAARAQAR